MTDHRHVPSSRPGDDVPDIGQIDPDVALFVDFLTGELGPADTAVVRARFVAEDAFYMKVAPAMKVWTLPSASYIDGSPESFVSSMPPRLTFRDIIRGTRDRFNANPTLVTTSRRFAKMSAIAGTLTVPVGIGIWIMMSTPSLPTDRVTTTYTPSQPVALKPSASVSTGPNETKAITLRGGSRVLLRPNSSWTYHYTGTLRLQVANGVLQGEAAFTVGGQDRWVRVMTDAGSSMLAPGTYALRCEKDCAAMLLTVGTGNASLRTAPGKPALNLIAGQRGRQPRDAPAEIVTPGTGWPELEPAASAVIKTGTTLPRQ